MNRVLQREQALERANEIRVKRAVLKRAVKSGEIRVTGILEDPVPTWLRSEPIGRLVKYIPRFGDKRTQTLLARIPVGYWRTLGNLTKREKTALILALKELKRFDA